MSKPFSRRAVLAGLGAVGALTLPLPAFAKTKPRVVIVGGGFGGASAARLLAPHVDVTLIEPRDKYVACPLSNLVVVGKREIGAQTFFYNSLKALGVKVVQEKAQEIDAENKVVTIRDKIHISYDRLILSPGISFKWKAIKGYDNKASWFMPHAWMAGGQTTALRKELVAMPNGGTVIISVPPAPFRCPPGPYERASLIAHYLKTHKPRSKLLILDSQDRFSKQPLFEAAWEAEYPGMIERIPGSESGQVVRVEPENMAVFTDFDTFKADVVNIIPHQQAGSVALASEAADRSGWCPINAATFESTMLPYVHVIGDATIAAPMPKSAFSANLQGKICALQVLRLLAGQRPVDTVLANTCFSYLTPETAVSVSGVYRNNDGVFRSVKGAGGTSPLEADIAVRSSEALQAADWFQTITREAFG